MAEEFNAWYDSEHLAERLAITGLRSARRWIADYPPGEGKYLATCEIDSSGVLQSRWACEQIEPGAGEPQPLARALLLVARDEPSETPAIPGALHIALIEFAWPQPVGLPGAYGT